MGSTLFWHDSLEWAGGLPALELAHVGRQPTACVAALLCLSPAAADLQAITDDMLVKLAPKFGVQLPPELQHVQDTGSSSSNAGQASGSLRSSSSRKATVMFPGDLKMSAAGAGV